VALNLAIDATLTRTGNAEQDKMAIPIGSITNVQIAEDGWSAWVTVAGLGKGGGIVNYNLFTLSAPNLVLSVREASGDTRDVAATAVIRKPFPEESQLDHKAVGDDLLVHVSLSEYIFSSSTATVSARPGWAMATIDGVATSTVGMSSLEIDNSSSIGVSRAVPIANFVTPDRQIVTDKIHVEVVAGSLFAVKGDEIAFVRFIASDRQGNEININIDSPSLSLWGKGDARPVYSYQASISTKGLAEDDLITIRAEVYDHIGNVVSSASKGSIVGDPAAFVDQVYLLDRDGSFGRAYAYVDASVANGSGKVSADQSLAALTPFKTIAAAMIATQSFNLQNFGRANIDNAEILLKAGTHTWVGGPISGTNAVSKDVWATIMRDPTAAKDAVRIIGATDGRNNFANADYIKVEDLTIDRTAMGSSSATIMRGQGSDSLWLHNVVFEGSNRSTASFLLPDIWVTQSEFNGTGRALSTFSNNLNMFRIRGVDADSAAGSIVNGHLLVGSVLDNLAIRYPNTPNMPNADGSIVAFNDVKSSSSTALFAAGGSYAINGIAVLNNRFVRIDGPSPAISISGDGQKFDASNIVFHNNTVVGQRMNIGYNDLHGSQNDKELVSIKWNNLHQLNTKHDVFSKDIENTGAWSILYGVGFESNYIANKPAGKQISFGPAFDGIGSFGPGVALHLNQSDAPDFIKMDLLTNAIDSISVDSADDSRDDDPPLHALNASRGQDDERAASSLDQNIASNVQSQSVGSQAPAGSAPVESLVGINSRSDDLAKLGDESRPDGPAQANHPDTMLDLSFLVQDSNAFGQQLSERLLDREIFDQFNASYIQADSGNASFDGLMQHSSIFDAIEQPSVQKSDSSGFSSSIAVSVFENTDTILLSESAWIKLGFIPSGNTTFAIDQGYENQIVIHI
jgi:hypothetical protein